MKRKIIIISLIALISLLIAASIGGYYLYSKIFKPNVYLQKTKFIHLYIPTGADFDEVLDSIKTKKILKDVSSFEWVAQKKNYPKLVKSGRYKIKNNMNNNDLVNLLRSGKQDPVKLTFNNVRTKEQLAGKIASHIEADSITVYSKLSNPDYLQNKTITSENILTIFIPNTYEVYWNTTPTELIKRMEKEHQKFWTEQRQKKAKDLGLTEIQVSILASIVQAEQNEKIDEQATVAGVFINRLKKGWNLESCPTLIYATGDFSIKRVLDKHKEIESPYNTYKNPGLPPGPINLPEISAIDAVLNYKQHEYMFFCVKEDFSGYHYFSKTLAQHEMYAKRIRNELNKRKY